MLLAKTSHAADFASYASPSLDMGGPLPPTGVRLFAPSDCHAILHDLSYSFVEEDNAEGLEIIAISQKRRV